MSQIITEELTKIGISLLIGSILGIEREYRNKPAGFRTISLICVGATLFTLVSIRLGNDMGHDRIAANIITGIGFIGAGVIFKGTNNVYGLTTAATIWVAAGLGMAVGAGDFPLALTVLGVSLFILAGFEYLQEKLDAFHKRRLYFIRFEGHTFDNEIEHELRKCRLRFVKNKERRTENETTCEYEVFGRQQHLDVFNEYLLACKQVKSFEY